MSLPLAGGRWVNPTNLCLFPQASLSAVIKSGSHAISMEESARPAAASGCVTAAIIYGVFFILSIGCCVYAKRNEAPSEASSSLKPVSIEDELLADASRA